MSSENGSYSGFDELPEEVIEELKLKGLYHFVVSELTSSSAITISIFENEKYRPLVGEWGSAVGIHLIPPFDRKPLTDDNGKHSLRGPLADIQPCKGYKWLGNWTIRIKKGITDDDGFQYAGGWSKLSTKHSLSDHAGRMRFVRRREWRRAMVLDPDPPAKRLPYELEIRIQSATVRGSSSSTPLDVFVDTYFNDKLHSTVFVSQKPTATAGAPGTPGAIISPGGKSAGAASNMGTTVIRPMHYLDPKMKISFVVHKNRVASANSSSSGRIDMRLSHILNDKNKGFVQHEYPLQNTNNKYLQLSIELREQVLFGVAQVDRQLTEGGQIIMSARMRDKIVILTLANESDSSGLLGEIVAMIAEAENYISELDLYDVIDDINQMAKNSHFSKLITLLQDHPLKNAMPFPLMHAEWCVYTKVVCFPAPVDASNSNASGAAAAAMLSPNALQRRNSFRGAGAGGGGGGGGAAAVSAAYQQRHAEVEGSNEGFMRYQPAMSRDRTPGFLRQHGDAPELANITPGLHGYRLTICCVGGAYYELIWGNFYEYIQVQKVLSMLKYQPEELESGHLDCSWQVLYYPFLHGEVARESVKATLSLDVEQLCFQIAAQRERGTDASEGSGGRPSSARGVQMWEPVTIGLDEIEYVEIGCAHHISPTYMLEVKVLSLQAQLLRYMMQNKTYIELCTADGQHFRVDLNSSKIDTYRLNSASLFEIGETVRVLVPAELMNTPEADTFLYMTIHTDGTWDACNATDITQRVAALANETDAFFPTPSSSVGSFKPERSRSMFSTKKSSSMLLKEQDPPPRETINRTVIKLCNRTVIPLSGLLNGAEHESQVTLLKLNCKWKLKVFKVDGQYPRRSTEAGHVYFVVYLANEHAEIIPYSGPLEERGDHMGSPQRSPKKTKSSSSISMSTVISGSSGGGSGAGAGYLYRSSLAASSSFASWNEADWVEISTEKHGDVTNHANYALVQFWTKYPSGSTPDTPLGEVLVPLLSAHNVEPSRFEAGGLDVASKHRVLLPSALNTRKTSQTVNTGLMATMLLNMCPVNDPDYDASDRVSIKLKTSLKPVQSADCSWPCRFLSRQFGGVEAEVFYFFPAHDGLYILGQSIDVSGELRRHPNSVGCVLSECAERISFIGQENRLQLMVPYSQVPAQDMHITSDNMLALNVQLHRCIRNPGAGQMNTRKVDITLEIIVGPCLAKDLFTIMHNRISLHTIRSTLASFVADKRKDDAEMFDNVAQMLHEEILQTIQCIDQYQALKPIDEGQQHGSRTQPAPENDDLSHLFPLKLLYLKKAALKIYLWFLIEQTTLQFTGISSSYLDSTKLLYNDLDNDPDSEGGGSHGILEDTDALVQRIGQLMSHLDRDVRAMVFQSHKQRKGDISNKLSLAVYNCYLTVIDYLMRSINIEYTPATGSANEKIYTTADPQKKRDLIKYIITHDNMFEVTLDATLRPHDYRFTSAPLLSSCIDFEVLIDKFAALVNENILLWNARTFDHFRAHKEKSNVLTNQDFAPWAVTTMIEAGTNHELYISNIPETIQTQLNVEIGLKKVPIAGSNLGAASLSRVYLLNQKISAAIAKVYLALASEYEKVLISGLQNKVLRDACNRSKTEMAVSEDDMIIFLVSLVNDCHRMYTKHIMESMSSFLDDDEDGNSAGKGGGDGRDMASIVESVQKEGVRSIMDQSCMLFLVSARAMEAVSQNAINLLSNQIFFYSELRVYFLLAFDAHVVTTQPARFRNRRASGLGAGGGEVAKVETHSPVEVICATLTDFFQFTSQHLNDDDIEKLLYVCIKKVVIRYLVFLRDLLVLMPTTSKPAKKGEVVREPARTSDSQIPYRKSLSATTREAAERESVASDGTGGTISDEEGDSSPDRSRHAPDYGNMSPETVARKELERDSNVPFERYDENDIDMGPGSIYEHSPLVKDQIVKVKRDVKTIIRLHSVLKLKIEQSGGGGGRGEGRGAGNSRSTDDGSEAGKEEEEFHSFFNNSAANLFGIMLSVANHVMMGDFRDTAAVDRVVYDHFSITPPPWTADRAAYEKALAAFLELNSNFIQQNKDGDAAGQAAGNYTIQISNLSCVKQTRYTNCFIRVIFDNQVRETPVRAANALKRAITWDGSVTFNDVQSYENKVVELQLMGYRLRALQHYRERLIGTVKINLSVLAQSSPYIADVAPAPSANRKSFAARMSMSETFSREALNECGASSADSIILANHCAWFVVDRKRKSGEGGRDAAAGADSKVGKTNSVVKLLSSENVRMDIEDTQLRVGIKMIKHNALGGK